MPAENTGMSGYAGPNPNITVSNALPGTAFNSGSAAAGVGTGSLGEFGGYIPTPLRQFNNYQDYLSYMPGAQQMDQFASDPLNYGGINMSDRWGFTQDVLRSPYQSGAMQGATDAQQAALGWSIDPSTGQMSGKEGGGFINKQWYPAAQDMFSQAKNLYGLEAPIQSQAFDPQNALYQRTMQQLQDQTRAGLEARGLGMDPFGAGVEGSTMSNFNIDWQNQQLQRETQGAQAIGSLAQEGAGLQQSGAQLQNQAAQATADFSQAPMDLWNSIMQTQTDAVNQYQDYGLKAMIPGQMTFKNWQDVQNQFLTAQQQSFGQNQISGFEDPFAEMQLQSQVEMEREQMNMQEKMQKEQEKSQMAMQGAQMGMGLLSGGKGCWIAEAIYGPDDMRTHLVRAWLNGPFKQTRTGRVVMAVYVAIGRPVAAVVRRSPVLQSLLHPIFNCALQRALEWSRV